MFTAPLPFQMPLSIVFWAAYVWTFFLSEWEIFRRSKEGMLERRSSETSLRSIAIIMLLFQLVAFVLAFYDPLRFKGPSLYVAFWVGIGLMVAASFLRRHCFRMLGEHFTIDVRVQPEQPIIDRGAYAVIRHPSYLAAILMFVGVGFALGNWASVVVLTASAVGAYQLRIAHEERVLEEVLGERYRSYMLRTKRLIPYVY